MPSIAVAAELAANVLRGSPAKENGTGYEEATPGATPECTPRVESIEKNVRFRQNLVTPSQSQQNLTDKEIWRAVRVGDRRAVRHMVDSGRCTAGLCDGAGHSVLWHLIAFGHFSLAVFLLDAYPFESPSGGPDVHEIHQKRGDTLLHLLCRATAFDLDTSEIFRRITACSGSRSLLFHTNVVGETFLDLAAASFNFWVVRYMLKNFAVESKELLCCTSGRLGCTSPLAAMTQRLVPPQSPAAPTLKPGRKNFLWMLVADPETGRVPHADMAFDVGPEGDANSKRSLLLAHSSVLGARSPVLLEAFRRSTAAALPQFGGMSAVVVRVDPRISRDVWKCVLHFLYSGEIRCRFSQDVAQLVELLRACVVYEFPRTLIEFVQATLCPLLITGTAMQHLQVFSLSARTPLDARLRLLREASALSVLEGAQELCSEMEPEDMSSILLRVFEVIETAIFRGR